MSAFREWAAALCALAIGCSLLSVLCPNGPMRRVCHVLTAVLFLCGLLSPMTQLVGFGGRLSFADDITVSAELTDEVNEQTQQILTDALTADAKRRLEGTATVKAVAVKRDETRTDGIYIERVRVTLDRHDREMGARVKQTLEQAWGILVEVYYVG